MMSKNWEGGLVLWDYAWFGKTGKFASSVSHGFTAPTNINVLHPHPRFITGRFNKMKIIKPSFALLAVQTYTGFPCQKLQTLRKLCGSHLA